MNVAGFSFDLSEAIELIKGNEYERVALQVPEGLRRKAPEIAAELERATGALVILAADPCFGACDTVSSDYDGLGVEFAVQIGHAPFQEPVEGGVTTLVVNAVYTDDIFPVLKRVVPHLQGKRVGVVTTAQHLGDVEEILRFLKEKDIDVIAKKGDTRVSEPGQVLGCNFSSAKAMEENVDVFLFVGSGRFHPLGLVLVTKKSVIAVDPYTGEIISEEEFETQKETLLRQRYGAIAAAKSARCFGIVVSVKPGQQRMQLALDCKAVVERAGLKAVLIAMQYLQPVYLENYQGVDCLVSTACPRIAIDDYIQYKTPMITPIELLIALDFKSWDEYTLDEFLGES